MELIHFVHQFTVVLLKFLNLFGLLFSLLLNFRYNLGLRLYFLFR